MPVVSTVAEQLRTSRESRHLTVEQVAEITKIRTDHLRALEEGNFDVFSAPVYIRGFVRSYSTLLKLDVPQIMAAPGECGGLYHAAPLAGELAQGFDGFGCRGRPRGGCLGADGLAPPRSAERL